MRSIRSERPAVSRPLKYAPAWARRARRRHLSSGTAPGPLPDLTVLSSFLIMESAARRNLESFMSWMPARQPSISELLIFVSSAERFLTSEDSTPKRKLSPVIPEEASTLRENADSKSGGREGLPFGDLEAAASVVILTPPDSRGSRCRRMLRRRSFTSSEAPSKFERKAAVAVPKPSA